MNPCRGKSKTVQERGPMNTVLVTGYAGFIGFHLTRRLLAAGVEVVGIDNFNDYYTPQLKRDRVAQLPSQGLVQRELDLADRAGMARLFEEHAFDRVIHLAAQAGVRYSVTNPHAYISSNLEGFLNILEGCRQHQVAHLVYASSSSVYGLNTAMPFSCSQAVDHPVSLYGASKKANEMMAHSYACMYGLPVTGLRFFTVYGPWGRPDMALYKFARAIMEGQPIDIYNHGQMQRDFTYVDDIVEGVARVAEHIPAANPQWDSAHPDPSSSSAPYRVFNIGNQQPVELLHFIDIIEKRLGRQAVRKLLPMQPGDVVATFADSQPLQELVGFTPSTPIEVGLNRTLDWYLDYRQQNSQL